LVPTAMVFCYKQIQQHNNAHHNMTWPMWVEGSVLVLTPGRYQP
jgi:hypothetical protein